MNKPSTSKSQSQKQRRAVIYCFVPKCPSNSAKFPDKKFLTVPLDPKRREKWMKVVGRQNITSEKSVMRCCEDHFDLENDLQNWIRHKYMGGNLHLKEGVCPHIFDCQQNLYTSKPKSVLKRKIHKANECIENKQVKELESPSCERSILKSMDKPRDQCMQVATFTHKRSKDKRKATETITNNFAASPKNIVMKMHRKTYPLILRRNYSNYSDRAYKKEINIKTEDGTGAKSGSVLSELLPQKIEQDKLAMQLTLSSIARDSKLYIGVPNDSIGILNIIEETIQVPYNHLCLVLKKLKLNESFKILANDFGVHESTASQIFSLTCCKIAKLLRTFIIKPSQQTVLANLPMIFRESFAKTYSIIDCLEIEIEIPTNALHQLLTYSSYKKCNTIKYLVSATPDGVINFVSEGFGGHTSDIRICQESNFYECLPSGVSIMADRGFKHIEGELAKRNIILIRLPNLNGLDQQLRSSQEELLAKKTTILRKYMKNSIRRLQEFAFLKSHACIDHNLIQYLDSAVIICSALVNMQPLLNNIL